MVTYLYKPINPMRNLLSGIYPILLVVALYSCQSKVSEMELSSSDFVFENANVIDVTNGRLTKAHVVVQGTTISHLIESDAPHTWGNAIVIPASGNYLLPGLAEMHAHIPSKEWNDPLIAETLFLYLSNGVTTIRGMLGNPVHLELREKAKTQEILGPRIFTSSPSLNGNTVRNPEEANTQVQAYAEAGYDFLKLHPGIRLHVFDEIVKTANQSGIPYAGHVSNLVRVRHALQNKYQTIDHVDGFIEGLVPEDAGVNPIENGFFGYNFTDFADTSNIAELVRMSKENGVWIVPTQALFDRWFSPISADLLVEEDEMKYMSPEIRNNWVISKNNLTETGNFDPAQWERFNQIRYQLIKELHKNGQGLLLGSDAPQVFNVPGFSIHHELQGMLDSGLTPLEALQIGTINPAIFFDGNFGQIKVGMDADLIMTDKNPLENLKNLQNPMGVMARGQWMDREMMQQKLSDIAGKYE